jgi:hypothetical protein
LVRGHDRRQRRARGHRLVINSMADSLFLLYLGAAVAASARA